jgi:hypothetical protein
MDIDITIKGGEELSRLNKKKYEAIVNKFSNEIMDAFPEVGCCAIGPLIPSKKELLQRKHQDQAIERARAREIKTALTEVLKEPEFQEILRARVAALQG